MVVARWAIPQEEVITDTHPLISDMNSIEHDLNSDKAMSSRMTDSYNKYEFLMREASDNIAPLIETQTSSHMALKAEDKTNNKANEKITNPFSVLYRSWTIRRIKRKLRSALAFGAR